MPDLRTELMKLENLKFDDDAQPNTQEVLVTTAIDPTASMMEQIWQYVHQNPNSTYTQVMKGIGEGQSDVSTRLTQMYYAGKLGRSETSPYQWFAVHDTYERKSSKPYKKRKVKSAKPVAKVGKPVPAAQPKSLTKYDVNDLLSTMSIVEARALYDRLKELFGG